MLNLWRKRRVEAEALPENAAMPALDWDLHAHLLPGVDDGVRDMDEALEGIRALQGLGYKGCIVTPHVSKDVFNNSTAKLQSVFETLQKAVQEAGLVFKLQLAAEYMADEHMLERIQQDDLLSFRSQAARHVLIEFSYFHEPLFWSSVLAALSQKGYQAVIAHPERYRYMESDTDLWLERFAQYDALYQCDIGALSGQYGPNVVKLAQQLLEKNSYTFWGTDLHRPSQAERFIRPSFCYLEKNEKLNNQLMA